MSKPWLHYADGIENCHELRFESFSVELRACKGGQALGTDDLGVQRDSLRTRKRDPEAYLRPSNENGCRTIYHDSWNNIP